MSVLDEANDEATYPEGGTKAWLVVLGAWCAMVPPMGLLNTLAVLQAWIAKNELAGIRESKIGWIFSCYAFFITACGAQVGKLSRTRPAMDLSIDRLSGPIFDAYDIRVLILPGSIGVVLCLIFMSLSTGMRL